jgi:hypothetical protein
MQVASLSISLNPGSEKTSVRAAPVDGLGWAIQGAAITGNWQGAIISSESNRRQDQDDVAAT